PPPPPPPPFFSPPPPPNPPVAPSGGLVFVNNTPLLPRARCAQRGGGYAQRDRNVNLDIGQRVTVPAWDNGRARVMYRGALWDVELGQGVAPHAGEFRIVEVHGSRLVVGNP
ncbi:NfeD family protein, partial [Massilia sp. CT11-108]|uniref:NfeD family protein n=1 Tax=Massilia sp. CT11-108 TaxID=3393900 RepID=UPI0039A764C3